MTTKGAVLAARPKESLAFVAHSPDALSRSSVHQVLSARLARAFSLDPLVTPAHVGCDAWVFPAGLYGWLRFLETGQPIRLGLSGRELRAFVAANVSTLGAFTPGRECRVALVTGAPDAHSDGLVHAVSGLVWGQTQRVGGFNDQPILLAQSFGPLLEYPEFRDCRFGRRVVLVRICPTTFLPARTLACARRRRCVSIRAQIDRGLISG